MKRIKVFIYTARVSASDPDPDLPVFAGYVGESLRFHGRGGCDIRRNHSPQNRIFGIFGLHPTLMAAQSEYNIAYYDED